MQGFSGFVKLVDDGCQHHPSLGRTAYWVVCTRVAERITDQVLLPSGEIPWVKDPLWRAFEWMENVMVWDSSVQIEERRVSAAGNSQTGNSGC